MKLASLKMPLIIIVVFACGVMFGMAYMFIIDPDNNFQKFVKEKHVILKEPKTLQLEGDPKKNLELPAGTVMYYEFSHKDFHSYASVQLKADYLDFESIVEPAVKADIYIMADMYHGFDGE